MKLQLKTERENESGAIMLEIIAVLALMGVMGAMLFRQINQRNQELHNIQMASEIRLVKEAFSAWLQTNQAVLTRDCLSGVTRCSNQYAMCNYDSATLARGVSDYVPDGYFVGQNNALSTNYDFYAYGYWVGQDGACSPAFYGVVVPKDVVLPDGGSDASSWNFKRAARVAMLVGGDGGAYDPDITGTDVVGSVGTWRLSADRTDLNNNNGGGNNNSNGGIPIPNAYPRYVAMTGLDVFQPEVEVPAGEVNVPEQMTWTAPSLGAWNTFVVGGAIGQQGCFEVNHATQNGGVVNPDIVHDPGAECDPVFWVDARNNVNTGTVFVRNDMKVGYSKDTQTSSIELNGAPGSEGEIVINDQRGNASVIISGAGATNNPNATLTFENGKIMTNRSTGNLNEGGNGGGYQYQLDPANTSVMYDIRLGARGGIKLSDLLPKHILQDIGQIACTPAGEDIVAPTCRNGYNAALVLIPSVSQNLNSLSKSDVAALDDWIVADGVEVHGIVTDVYGTISNTAEITNFTQPDSASNADAVTWGNKGSDVTVATLTDASRRKLSVPPVTISIENNSDRVVSHGRNLDSIEPRSNVWTVECSHGTGRIGYQTYCMLGNNIQNAAAGSDVNVMDQTTCISNGMKWNASGYCETGVTCTTISTEAACKRAGCLWDEAEETCRLGDGQEQQNP